MKPSALRRLAVLTRLTSRPDTSTTPFWASQNRMNSFSSVDLPAPLRPVTRTTSPGRNVTSTCSSTRTPP